MKKRIFIRKDERGVSPVIATILMVAITVVLAAVLYIMVMSIGDGNPTPPTGILQPPVVTSPTEVDVPFGKITPEQKPMNLEILLESNGTDQGRYRFSTNDDGDLAFVDGVDICDIEYVDLMNNGMVNIGDEIRITGLYPGSHYELYLIWAQNGDQIDVVAFSTPSV